MCFQFFFSLKFKFEKLEVSNSHYYNSTRSQYGFTSNSIKYAERLVRFFENSEVSSADDTQVTSSPNLDELPQK